MENPKKDFVTSDLIKIRPEKLLKQDASSKNDGDRLSAYMMMLATYFNDLKGLVHINEWKKAYRFPDQDETTSHAGEYNGVQNQLNRMLVSTLHELTVCIDKNKEIMESADFTRYENKLDSRVRPWWDDLKNFSINGVGDGDKTSEFQHFLLMVRNNVSSHVQNPKPIIEGYLEHFYNKTGKGGEKEDFVFYAYDQSDIFRTRFYFADATTGSYFRKRIEEVGDTQHTWNKTVEWSIELTKILSDLVASYLKEKPEVR